MKDMEALKGKVTQMRSLQERVLTLETNGRKLQDKLHVAEKGRTLAERLVETGKEERQQLVRHNGDLQKSVASLNQQLAAKRRRTRIHLPLYRNKICDTPLVDSEDLNTTTECYHDPDRGLNCVHLSLNHDGPIYDLFYQRSKKRVARK